MLLFFRMCVCIYILLLLLLLFYLFIFSSVSESIFQVLDELQRVIQPTNSQYISEMKSRWEAFYSKVQFYGVMKKAMKPPKTLNGGEITIDLFILYNNVS